MVDLRELGNNVPDGRGFEEFYAQEHGRLCRSLTLMCGDAEQAADCLADAFERACVRWDHVRLLEDPAGWVRRVAINRLHDARRTLVRRDALLVRIGVDPDVAAADTGSDDTVLAAVAGLSDQQRAVVALHYLDDQPVDEVAEVLGLSTGTVKYHLHQARRRLRAVVGRQGGLGTDGTDADERAADAAGADRAGADLPIRSAPTAADTTAATF